MSLTYYFLPTRNVFGEGAVNEAGKKADEMVQKSMSQVTGGLGLPGGMF